MNGWLAIDPGVSGAVALVRDDGSVSLVVDTPVAGKDIDGAGLAMLLRDYVGAVRGVVLERVGAMPKQGVSSTFRFGRSLGVLEGACLALGLRVEWVAPVKWKRHYGLIGQDKDMARRRALERWPGEAAALKRKKDVGRADALLMAAWGVEVLR